MPNSYIKATQTVGSLSWPPFTSAIGVVSTAFTNVSSSSDWSVNGSGGLVYSGSTSGKAIPFSVDYKYDSYSISGNDTLNIYIVKNASNYVVATWQIVSTGTGPYIGSKFFTAPIVCEPGDIFYFGVKRQSAGSTYTSTNTIITFNIGSSN